MEVYGYVIRVRESDHNIPKRNDLLYFFDSIDEFYGYTGLNQVCKINSGIKIVLER